MTAAAPSFFTSKVFGPAASSRCAGSQPASVNVNGTFSTLAPDALGVLDEPQPVAAIVERGPRRQDRNSTHSSQLPTATGVVDTADSSRPAERGGSETMIRNGTA